MALYVRDCLKSTEVEKNLVCKDTVWYEIKLKDDEKLVIGDLLVPPISKIANL